MVFLRAVVGRLLDFGLTLRQIARMSGFSKYHISRVSNGRVPASELLKRTLDDLLVRCEDTIGKRIHIQTLHFCLRGTKHVDDRVKSCVASEIFIAMRRYAADTTHTREFDVKLPSDIDGYAAQLDDHSWIVGTRKDLDPEQRLDVLLHELDDIRASLRSLLPPAPGPIRKAF